jgi:branched-subunit amino acid ABC-type transport system permease component
MAEILQQLINALLLGCTYTLIAIGFNLFFGASMLSISPMEMSASWELL